MFLSQTFILENYMLKINNKTEFENAKVLENFSANSGVLTDCVVLGTIFKNGEIKNTSLVWSSLDTSEFTGCAISWSTFSKSSLENVLFKDCKIKSSDFIKTNLRNAVFNSCAISYCDFSMSDLRDARFFLSDAEAHEFLTTCTFDHTKLGGAEMNGSSLYEEVLKYKK